MTKIIKKENWQIHSAPRCPRRPIAPKKFFEHLQLIYTQDTDTDEESTISLKNVNIPPEFTYKDICIKYEWSNDYEANLMKVYLLIQKDNPNHDEQFLKYNKELVEYNHNYDVWLEECRLWNAWKEQCEEEKLQKEIERAEEFLKKHKQI